MIVKYFSNSLCYGIIRITKKVGRIDISAALRICANIIP